MQSAPVKSEAKTSSKLRGVRGAQSAGACISRPKLRAEIALARIRQDGEQAFSRAQLRRDDAAGVKNRSRGDPAKNPLLLRKTARSASRVVIRNRDETMNNVFIEDLGNESGADTLNFVRTRLTTGKHRRVGGFHSEQL